MSTAKGTTTTDNLGEQTLLLVVAFAIIFVFFIWSITNDKDE